MQRALRTYLVTQSHHGTHANGARKRGPILVLAFSHVAHMFVYIRIFEKKECLRSLSIQNVFVN